MTTAFFIVVMGLNESRKSCFRSQVTIPTMRLNLQGGRLIGSTLQVVRGLCSSRYFDLSGSPDDSAPKQSLLFSDLLSS